MTFPVPTFLNGNAMECLKLMFYLAIKVRLNVKLEILKDITYFLIEK